MAEFAPRPGCPMCSIVASASHLNPNSRPTENTKKEILWRDDNFTAYRENAHPVSSQGHIIIAFNLHVDSVYKLACSDLPLLVNIKNLSVRLLSSLLPGTTPVAFSTDPAPESLRNHASNFRIGFITAPFKDTKIPVGDHLHAHAFIGTADLAGWWRGIAYSSIAWYDINDLVAEIRETVSNNRIKSGYENRSVAPIEMVPGAGAREGLADGTETTRAGIASQQSNPEESV